ncbi:MAG: hypothetical protein R3343_12310 [Nitriliruptorales bacterium]|nr:hypothetical protein [Nitriliruptorales bacterium]
MSTRVPQPKSESLRKLYWRDEILQVLFWMEGEGFGDQADLKTLERFLGVEAEVIDRYLDVLVDEGYLDRIDTGEVALSDRGREDGGRIFAEEFADLTRPAHGECGPECWCHSSPEEAEACIEERLAGGRTQ